MPEDWTVFFAVIGAGSLGFMVLGASWEIGRTIGVIISNRMPDRWFGSASQ